MVAVTAIDSILMSISGITGVGVAPKSDSKVGIVSTPPVAPSATVESATTKEAVKLRSVPAETVLHLLFLQP